ncbi:MAG: CHAT domain-containing protein [Rubrivivax sp.]
MCDLRQTLTGIFALLTCCGAAATPMPAAMPDMNSALCPRPLGDEPTIPPTLRVGLLWRMPSVAEQMSGRYLPHPSSGNDPSYAGLLRANARVRLDVASFNAGTELLAGRHDRAQRQLEACLADAAAVRDAEAEGACANNLGVLTAAQGRFPQAQALFERAQARYRDALAETDAKPAEQMPLPIPVPAEMTALFAATLSQQRRMGPALGLMRSHLNLGQLAISLGRLEPAEAHFNHALKASVGLPAACRAVPASDLARLYQRLGRSAEALAVREQHPAAAAPQGVPSAATDGMSGDMGRVALAPVGAQTPSIIVSAQPRPEGLPRGLEFGQPLSLGSEVALQSLLAKAGDDERAEHLDAALAGYGRAALRGRALRRLDTELSARAGLMRVHAAAGRRGAAIVHGKLAVTLVQALHQGDGGAQLDRATRRTLLRQRQQVHQKLAPLLIDDGRLAEVEQVLLMLKQDEGLQFKVSLDAKSAVRLAVTPADQSLAARADSAGAELLNLDAQRRSVADDPLFAVALAATREGLERARLQIAADVVGFLRAPDRSRLEAELRGLPVETREPLERLMAGNGERLATALRHLAEDASLFSDARPTAAQAAQVAEAARRASEFHVAFAPALARLLREPGKSRREMDRPLSPADIPSPEELLSPQNLRAMVQQALSKVLGGSASKAPSVPAVTPPTAEAVRELAAMGGMLVGIEALERMWRLDQARDRVERKHLAAESEALAELERSPSSAAPGLPSRSPPGATSEDSVVTLAREAPTAALLYFLPGAERTDVLVVTSRGRQAVRLTLALAKLDTMVLALQAALRQPRLDPRPPARALHDALFAPLRPLLDQAGTHTIVLSLHGRLRYVPFAALHDGQKWLVERYAVVAHPGAQLAELLRPTSPRWRVAAFGASAGGAGLAPLPAVPAEVRGVVGEGSGASRGQAWIDRAFNADALRQALVSGQHQVLHIASHFKFEPGDAAASFLLMGDGSRLNLKELGGPDYRFDRLEMVALSACETALSEDDAYGQEIDGLGALLMAQGARAVLASLWQVADDSTGELMSSVYRLREGDAAAPLPLAQALRQAQLAMIRAAGTGAAVEADASRGAVRRVVGNEAALGVLAGRSHPYHWAPFVLMGNWR